MKNVILIILIVFISYGFGYISRLENNATIKEQHIHELKETLSDCNNAYIEHIKIIKLLEPFRDHVKRMQVIAGVKNVDSVFTWKEKVLNPIDTKEILIYK